MLTLLADVAGNGPASKKKLKKKRKKHQEEEDEEFPTVKDICSDTEDSGADHVGTEHQQKQPKTEHRGGQNSNNLCNNTTHVIALTTSNDLFCFQESSQGFSDNFSC